MNLLIYYGKQVGLILNSEFRKRGSYLERQTTFGDHHKFQGTGRYAFPRQIPSQCSYLRNMEGGGFNRITKAVTYKYLHYVPPFTFMRFILQIHADSFLQNMNFINHYIIVYKPFKFDGLGGMSVLT